MDDLLPAELFMPGRLWFLSTAPLPKDLAEEVLNVVRIGVKPQRYIPAFTSEPLAIQFAQQLSDSERTPLVTFTHSDLADRGRFLDAVPQTHIAFNPEPDHADLKPIERVALALFRHVRGPGPN